MLIKQLNFEKHGFWLLEILNLNTNKKLINYNIENIKIALIPTLASDCYFKNRSMLFISIDDEKNRFSFEIYKRNEVLRIDTNISLNDLEYDGNYEFDNRFIRNVNNHFKIKYNIIDFEKVFLNLEKSLLLNF